MFLKLRSKVLPVVAMLLVALCLSAVQARASTPEPVKAVNAAPVAADTDICSFWISATGRVFAELHKDPGGDGALYLWVNDSVQTWFTRKGRWFYVSGTDVDVIGRNSADQEVCSHAVIP